MEDLNLFLVFSNFMHDLILVFKHNIMKNKIRTLKRGITRIKNEIEEVESAIGINNDFNEMDRLLVRMSGLHTRLNNQKEILFDYTNTLSVEQGKS